MNPPIDLPKYQRYLQEYVDQALANSDGSPGGVRDYLEGIQVKGWLVKDKPEKQRALADAIQAFSEHRHWPLDIILSHLGLEPQLAAPVVGEERLLGGEVGSAPVHERLAQGPLDALTGTVGDPLAPDRDAV